MCCEAHAGLDSRGWLNLSVEEVANSLAAGEVGRLPERGQVHRREQAVGEPEREHKRDPTWQRRGKREPMSEPGG